jgi:hypothetical protein
MRRTSFFRPTSACKTGQQQKGGIMVIDAARARQCRPFVAVLATVLFLAASAFAQDGSYLESGDSNFNNPANWSGRVVPKGTATVALKNRTTSILFNQPYTELDAIVVGYFAPLVVGTGKSVTLRGRNGLSIVDDGTAMVDGKFEGAVFSGPGGGGLRGRGVIEGNVTMVGSTVGPGGLNQEGGRLTIKGSLTLVNDATLLINVTGAGDVSRLDVTTFPGYGRATIGPGVWLVFGCYTPTLPYDKPIPILTTANALLGKFDDDKIVGCGRQTVVTYDDKNAYVTFKR